ncbi:MAG: hypothetical protein Q9161_001883 [Pseudevernia consocians]
MPIANADLWDRSPSPEAIGQPLLDLPFPPVTKSHILNCSYESWYLRYRSLTPKARLIPLSASFLSYLRADGIILPPEDIPSSNDSNIDEEGVEEDDAVDPSQAWFDIHQKIKSTISELDGSVMPKLNWSAPKDATWISATNSMACTTPNDVYLLLKSSDFITHDLEQVFDDCEVESEDESNEGDEDEEISVDEPLSKIPYHLVLRKTIPAFNPALEIRCFVRSRHLLCMCQRDLNHFDFLPRLIPKLRSLIQDSFDKNLKRNFPDENFVFDVYIPPPHDRVWLIDVNPWAPRTDPLLFSWLEILNMRGEEQGGAGQLQDGVIRLSLSGNGSTDGGSNLDGGQDEKEEQESEEEDEEEEEVFTPEFRLVNRDDPEAYNFNTPQYSAHKLPKDVVDASADGEAGLREFMDTWREIVARQETEDREEKGIEVVDGI